jgi:hypothetical protein
MHIRLVVLFEDDEARKSVWDRDVDSKNFQEKLETLFSSKVTVYLAFGHAQILTDAALSDLQCSAFPALRKAFCRVISARKLCDQDTRLPIQSVLLEILRSHNRNVFGILRCVPIMLVTCLICTWLWYAMMLEPEGAAEQQAIRIA